MAKTPATHDTDCIPWPCQCMAAPPLDMGDMGDAPAGAAKEHEAVPGRHEGSGVGGQ